MKKILISSILLNMNVSYAKFMKNLFLLSIVFICSIASVKVFPDTNSLHSSELRSLKALVSLPRGLDSTYIYASSTEGCASCLSLKDVFSELPISSTKRDLLFADNKYSVNMYIRFRVDNFLIDQIPSSYQIKNAFSLFKEKKPQIIKLITQNIDNFSSLIAKKLSEVDTLIKNARTSGQVESYERISSLLTNKREKVMLVLTRDLELFDYLEDPMSIESFGKQYELALNYEENKLKTINSQDLNDLNSDYIKVFNKNNRNEYFFSMTKLHFKILNHKIFDAKEELGQMKMSELIDDQSERRYARGSRIPYNMRMIKFIVQGKDGVKDQKMKIKWKKRSNLNPVYNSKKHEITAYRSTKSSSDFGLDMRRPFLIRANALSHTRWTSNKMFIDLLIKESD
jgi:hypothetical protein